MSKFGDALARYREGHTTFEELVQATSTHWTALAHYVCNRWRGPFWVAVEDVRQDLLYGAWRAIFNWDEGRGSSLAGYVVWNAVDKAKKRMHKARGAELHRTADSNPSRHELLATIEGVEPWAEIGVPAEQEAIVERRQHVERVSERCHTVREALVVRALADTGSVRDAAMVLYGHPDTRRECRFGSDEHAEEATWQAAFAVAERLGQQEMTA